MPTVTWSLPAFVLQANTAFAVVACMFQLVLIETYCWRALSTNEARRFFHALFADFQTILAFAIVARLLQLARVENDSRHPFAANSAK